MEPKQGKRPDLIGIGCLPAVIFGALTVPPTFLGSILGDCFDHESGACTDTGTFLLTALAVLVALSLFITWATNRIIARFSSNGGSVWRGIGGGCALALLVIVLLCALLISRA